MSCSPSFTRSDGRDCSSESVQGPAVGACKALADLGIAPALPQPSKAANGRARALLGWGRARGLFKKIIEPGYASAPKVPVL